ncbi:MAG: glucose 1-dehydrogenase [Thermoproteota archaeon]|nr:glucose 1-dehydrogenase [Thermoproteota archaeon]
MTSDNNNMNMGKVAVITGSSRGIGKAIAKEFAKNGYSIVLNSRDEHELNNAIEEIVGDISNDGNRIASVVGDVSDEETGKKLMDTAISKFGKINVLVNNAGISGNSKKINDLSLDDWNKVIDVNLKGAFICTREALKYILRQIDNNQNPQSENKTTSQGNMDFNIINISSVHESIPQPSSVPYSASKGGMEMLTKTVALEMAERGIRVNGIAPGAIATDMNKDILNDTDKKKQTEQKIPVKRIGEPEEIASVALFLASPAASYITGTTIYADGGLTLAA